MELTKTAKLEALLFASGDPLTLERAAAALYCSTDQVADLLEALQKEYQMENRGIELRKVAGGWQLVTKKQAAGLVRRLHEKQEVKLSGAAMETLAIIAFRQPVTKSEMEAIRGVKVDGVLSTLVDLDLVGEVGRKEVIGRPILYGTTEEFLQAFGFNSLEDLPQLPEEILDGTAEEPKERLQKVMAACGVASRRECEKYITAGRVAVNGRTVTELGTRVGSGDAITVDGTPLRRKTAKRTILLYKPRGVVTTMKDPQGRRTVADLVAKLPERLFPVGRLDYQTEGLLLMTNDGELAQHLTHPSHHVNKTYEVEVRGRVPEEKLDLLRLGIPLDDGLTAPALVYIKDVDTVKHLTRFTITIHEGRNRQVRRMCDFIGFPVKHLKRIQVGSLTLEGMKKGQYRDLTPEELTDLEKGMESHE